MDAKITKKRFTAMLSYDWFKIVALALATCFLWTFVFTVSSTRITHSQEFVLFNHSNNADLSDEFYAVLEDSFSYEVIETNIRDLASTPDQANTVYQSYFGADMGDIIFVANNPAEPTDTQEGKEPEPTPAQALINGYHGYLQPADDFVQDIKTYLAPYFTNGDKVQSDFLAMIKQKKDKRFKTQAQIDVGLTDEYARIQSYYDAVQAFDSYLESGLIRYEKAISSYDTSGVEKNYFLNICPDNHPNLANMKKYVSWMTSENKRTAQNMCVVFVKLNMDTTYTAECLLLVTRLISLAYTA